MLEWAHATRPLEGQSLCGDAHTVCTFDGGMLLAAIDGLGHGAQAHEAAQLAVKVLCEDPSLPVDEHLRRCHDRLKSTRGAVMSVARFDLARSELTWSGVGNVEGVVVRGDPSVRPHRHSLLVFGGVVGGQLAGIRTARLPIFRGDVMMFATDGVRSDFLEELEVHGELDGIAKKSLLKWGRGNDDALVLIARWQGGAGK